MIKSPAYREIRLYVLAQWPSIYMGRHLYFFSNTPTRSIYAVSKLVITLDNISKFII